MENEKSITTGKSLSEALHWITSSMLENSKLKPGKNMLCTEIITVFRTIFVHNMFSPWSAKRRASDKDLPVTFFCCFLQQDGSSKLFVNTAKHDFRTGRHNLQIVMCVRKLRFWKYYIIKTFIKTFIKNAYNFTILVTNSL